MPNWWIDQATDSASTWRLGTAQMYVIGSNNASLHRENWALEAQRDSVVKVAADRFEFGERCVGENTKLTTERDAANDKARNRGIWITALIPIMVAETILLGVMIATR